jgi:hypothetical protein
MVNANTAAGITKWEAVKRALEAFFEDEASAGISVGMQYFPILQNCTSRAQCSEGICFGGTCSGPGPVGFCGSSLDCPRGGACNALGECSAINAYCDPRSAGADCGQCTPLEPMCATVTFEGQTVSTLYHGSCEVSGYANPVVPIAPLPGAAQDLVSSLASADPLGGTPMAPALTGAIELARQHAGANPSHTVATVLATDGFPSECIAGNVADGLPEVRNIATSGTQGDNPIRTFVVGVFGPEDYTQLQTTPAILTARMDELAAAGGTDKSFIVSTDQDVTAKFIEALNVIRQSALGCNFEIPQPAEGELDYFQVNVQVTNQAGVRNRLFYVGSAAGCATVAEGGWYYDVDPESGQTPTTIIACDQNCAELQRGTIRQVDIELGCQTIEPIVR